MASTDPATSSLESSFGSILLRGNLGRNNLFVNGIAYLPFMRTASTITLLYRSIGKGHYCYTDALQVDQWADYLNT